MTGDRRVYIHSLIGNQYEKNMGQFLFILFTIFKDIAFVPTTYLDEKNVLIYDPSPIIL